MRKSGYIIAFFILAVTALSAQDIKTVKYEKMLDIIGQKDDKLIIVNFWATWCGPCIEEIPHFVTVFNQYRKQANLDLVFVSLDNKTNLKDVTDFVKVHKMPGELLLLDDVKRFNEWIPMIYPDWGGNIPATGFYRKGELLEFYSRILTEKELTHVINKLK